jgi:hypothetical protein
MSEPESVPNPPARQRKFACIDLGVAPPPPEMRVAFPQVPMSAVEELAQNLAKKITESPPLPTDVQARIKPGDIVESAAVYPRIDIKHYPPLHARISRFGQTALVAHWVHRMTVELDTGRHGGVLQAVSLYLTGLDRRADNCAISACQLMKMAPGKPGLPIPPGVWDKLREDPQRPLAVQIFVQPLARLDQSIRTAFFAVASAFFGSLGIDEESEASEQDTN